MSEERTAPATKRRRWGRGLAENRGGEGEEIVPTANITSSVRNTKVPTDPSSRGRGAQGVVNAPGGGLRWENPRRYAQGASEWRGGALYRMGGIRPAGVAPRGVVWWGGGPGVEGGGWRERGEDGFIRRIDVEVEEEGSTSFDPLCGRGDSNLIWPDHPWPSAERISKERGKGGGRG